MEQCPLCKENCEHLVSYRQYPSCKMCVACGQVLWFAKQKGMIQAMKNESESINSRTQTPNTHDCRECGKTQWYKDWFQCKFCPANYHVNESEPMGNDNETDKPKCDRCGGFWGFVKIPFADSVICNECLCEIKQEIEANKKRRMNIGFPFRCSICNKFKTLSVQGFMQMDDDKYCYDCVQVKIETSKP